MRFGRAAMMAICLTAVLGVTLPAFAGPAVASRWLPTELAQADCLKNAEAAIRGTGLEIPESTEESRYGTQRDYTGVVRCLTGKGLVIFVGSGPSRPIADNLAGALLNNFRAAASK
jgi:hypothetical protein